MTSTSASRTKSANSSAERVPCPTVRIVCIVASTYPKAHEMILARFSRAGGAALFSNAAGPRGDPEEVSPAHPGLTSDLRKLLDGARRSRPPCGLPRGASQARLLTNCPHGECRRRVVDEAAAEHGARTRARTIEISKWRPWQLRLSYTFRHGALSTSTGHPRSTASDISPRRRSRSSVSQNHRRAGQAHRACCAIQRRQRGWPAPRRRLA